MFFKLAVLKNLAITVKKTPILDGLFNKFAGLYACILLKRGSNSGVFLRNFQEQVFFVEYLTVCYTFSKFYMMIEFLDVFGYKTDIFSSFLCHCFDFLHGPWLFRTCFQTKSFSNCKF